MTQNGLPLVGGNALATVMAAPIGSYLGSMRDDRAYLSRLQALAHHGELFLSAPGRRRSYPRISMFLSLLVVINKVVCLSIMVREKPCPVFQGARPPLDFFPRNSALSEKRNENFSNDEAGRLFKS
jgi:hypothetical protein